ncbi:hypothetical protein PHET_12305 [Paragonimus heterotremus]|uniref:Reverse transcriptase RNase H-like domain-containing protein n=1 Tax=Paragonimus heterotremus TaxID=100268 RepID=A0A8J4SMW1_9TREM|nr:hypothetical protein PHET_12305 [Paragonimus heterotremus]
MSKGTTLITDASNVGIGAVLEQEGYPIICISRLLSKAEQEDIRNTQKEALAVYWVVKRLHTYLFGIRFKMVTNHQAQQYLFDPHKSVAKSSAAMIQQRWSLVLAVYDYGIIHHPGKQIPQADFLSRYSSFSAPEVCLLASPVIPISREGLIKTTKNYYSTVIATMTSY